MIERMTLRLGRFHAGLLAGFTVVLVASTIFWNKNVSPVSGAGAPPVALRVDDTVNPWLRGRGASEVVIPATLFGMHTMGFVYPLPIPFGAQAKSTGTAWPYLEPARGVFDWSTEDVAVAAAAANNVAPPFYSSDGIPSWATTDTKTCTSHFAGGALLCSAMMKDIRDWDEFVSAFVKRYKGKMIYELWNEPNTNNFSGTVYDMVKITKHEHDIIRQDDPAAMIIAPSADARYLDRFFAAGGTRDVDIIAYHEYNSEPEDIIRTISRVRGVMAKYGLANKPLWDTEGGWASVPYVNGKVDDYPGYVARRYLIEWSRGVDRFYWYAWNNERFGTLSHTSNVANAAGIAYRETFKWMVGARMVSPCVRNGTVWTCGLARSNGYRALAVWSTSDEMPYAPPEIYHQYRELNGNTASFRPGSAVTIGFRPVLFENKTAAAMARALCDQGKSEIPCGSLGQNFEMRIAIF
jgi:hypothetical protein